MPNLPLTFTISVTFHLPDLGNSDPDFSGSVNPSLFAIDHIDFTDNTLGLAGNYPSEGFVQLNVTEASVHLSGSSPVSTFDEIADLPAIQYIADVPTVSNAPIPATEASIQIEMIGEVYHDALFDSNSLDFTGAIVVEDGDTGAIALEAIGGTVDGGAVVGAMVGNDILAFLSNTLTADGSAFNEVHGDMENVVLEAVQGNDGGTSDTAGSFAQVDDNTIESTGNHIAVSGRQNEVFGSAGSILLEGVAGKEDNTQGSDTHSNDIAGNVEGNILNFTDTAVPSFALSGIIGNTITVAAGDAVTTVFGTAENLVLEGIGGSETNTAVAFDPTALDANPDPITPPTTADLLAEDNTVLSTDGSADNNIIIAGDNLIHLGTGVETVFGSLDQVGFIAEDPAGTATGSADITGTVSSDEAQTLSEANHNILELGANTINQPNVSETTQAIVFGDMSLLDQVAEPGHAVGYAHSIAEVLDNTVTELTNFISLGNGNHNIEYGNLQSDISLAFSENNSSGATVTESTPGLAEISGNTMHESENILSTGNGTGDIAYGHMQLLDWAAVGGTTNTGSEEAVIDGNHVLEEGSNITLGFGSGDEAFGNFFNMEWIVDGGVINTETVLAIDPSTIHDTAEMVGNTIVDGGNVEVSNGANATLFGTGEDMSFSVNGGNAGTSEGDVGAFMLDNTILSLGNTEVAHGANVTEYAALENLTFTETGDGSFSGNELAANPFDAPIVDTGNLIEFGNNTLTDTGSGGNLWGSDVADLSGLAFYLTALNQIIWSLNNILTASGSNEHFNFELYENPSGGFSMPSEVANEGGATITDLNPTVGDKVVLHTNGISEHTAAALDTDAVATFSEVGTTTHIAFEGGGNIDIAHQDYTSFTEMGTALTVI